MIRSVAGLVVLLVGLASCSSWANPWPEAPVVTDDGAFVVGRTVNARWEVNHPGGIDMIRWGVTKYTNSNPEMTDWIYAGTDSEGSVYVPELEYGEIYYVCVQARSGAYWSAIGYSDGILCVNSPPTTLAATKSGPFIPPVAVAARPVTAVFDDHFYIQEPTRSMGIRFKPVSMPPGLAEGNLVDVGCATSNYNAHLERALAGTASIVGTTQPIAPVTMKNCDLGGSSWIPTVFVVQEGVFQAVGLNNIGLLVKTTGRVKEYGPSLEWIMIEDGSRYPGGQVARVKAIIPAGTAIPALGDMVSVTGISSCEMPTFKVLKPVIKCRFSADIQVLAQP